MTPRAFRLLAVWGTILSAFAFTPSTRASQILPGGISWTESSNPVSFTVGGNTYVLSDLHFVSNQPFTLPDPGPTFAADSFFDVFAEVKISGASIGETVTGTLNVSVAPPTVLPDGTDVYQTEMLSMSLQGAPLGSTNPLMIRESPTLQSLGQTQINDTGGEFKINSFFDVFTELSIDNGQTWLPAGSPLIESIAPLPSSALAGIVLLGGLGLARCFRRDRGLRA